MDISHMSLREKAKRKFTFEEWSSLTRSQRNAIHKARSAINGSRRPTLTN